jgi:hypothetical protein
MSVAGLMFVVRKPTSFDEEGEEAHFGCARRNPTSRISASARLVGMYVWE